LGTSSAIWIISCFSEMQMTSVSRIHKTCSKTCMSWEISSCCATRVSRIVRHRKTCDPVFQVVANSVSRWQKVQEICCWSIKSKGRIVFS
jgi:hypothetical protein